MPSARTSGRGRGAARAAAAALLLALIALLGLSPAPARAVQTGALGFSDVSYTSWYYLDGSLGYVVDAGLMSGHKNDDGTPSGRFEPEGPVTRGQVATVLYRIANDDTSAVDDPGSYGQSTSFSDVRTNYYYTAAVEWCYGRGIVTGYKDEATQEPTGEFGPDAPVTRQELATMLWRFADSELGGAAAPSGQTYEGMPDAAMVQPFAREAMAWCFSEGILTGSKDPEGALPDMLLPREQATRAQFAKMVRVLLGGEVPELDPSLRNGTYVDKSTTLYEVPARITVLGGRIVSIEAGANWGIQPSVTDDLLDVIGQVLESNSIQSIEIPTGEGSWLLGEFVEAVSGCLQQARGEKPISDVSNFEPLTYAVLFADGTLVFQNETPVGSSYDSVFDCWAGMKNYSLNGADIAVWSNYSYRVKSVVVRDSFAPNTVKTWFKGMSKCVSMDLGKLDVSNVKSFSNAFAGCSSLVELDLSNWNVNGDAVVWSMFEGCSSLEKLDVSGWDMSEVTSFLEMFRQCSSLETLDLSTWNTSNATDMSYMFDGCSSLKSVNWGNWETSRVVTFSGMFRNCSSLVSLNLSKWDTKSVYDFTGMFDGCESLTSLDISEWNTSRLRYMQYMFRNCSSLVALDFSGFGWDTMRVTLEGFDGMFEGCTSLASVGLNDYVTFASYLPIPSSRYIPGADGRWHAADGSAWAPSQIPAGFSGTLAAVPRAAAAEAAPAQAAGAPAGEAALESPVAPEPTAAAFVLYADGELVVGPAPLEPDPSRGLLGSWELAAGSSLEGAASAPWAGLAGSVSSVRVLEGVRPSSCAWWFAGMSSCLSFDLAGLDTSLCSDMAGMFEGCC